MCMYTPRTLFLQMYYSATFLIDFDYPRMCARRNARVPRIKNFNTVQVSCRSTKAATPFNYTLVSEFGEETSSKCQTGTR